MGRKVPVEIRFWEKVNVTDDCWQWLGAVRKVRNGNHPTFGAYPELRETYAHRVSWILHYGNIEPGLQVLHKCDNPMCVRPNHLFLGTHADNTNDMFRKERRPYSKGKSKITKEDANDIRRLFLEGKGAPELATTYNMTKRNIYDIVNNVTWKDLKLEISQEELLELANKYEPDASSSSPSYRQATCVKCGKPMIYMWHLWLKSGGFKKECHLCFSCGKPYMVN